MNLMFVCRRCGLICNVDTEKEPTRPGFCPNCSFLIMPAAKKQLVKA